MKSAAFFAESNQNSSDDWGQTMADVCTDEAREKKKENINVTLIIKPYKSIPHYYLLYHTLYIMLYYIILLVTFGRCSTLALSRQKPISSSKMINTNKNNNKKSYQCKTMKPALKKLSWVQILLSLSLSVHFRRIIQPQSKIKQYRI